VPRTLLSRSGFPDIRVYRQNKWRSGACWHCINVEQTVAICASSAHSNLIYYPLREGYLDFRWDSLGQLLAWANSRCMGKADFFRLRTSSPGGFLGNTSSSSIRGHPNPAAGGLFAAPPLAMLWASDIAGNVVWNFDEFNPVGWVWEARLGRSTLATKARVAFSNGLLDAGRMQREQNSRRLQPQPCQFRPVS